MRGLEIEGPFLTTQRLEVENRDWDAIDETPPLLLDSPRFRVVRKTLPFALLCILGNR